MSNDATSERLWILDTVAVIKAVGTPVRVRKVVLYPSAINDDAVIQEYGADGVLRTAIHLKASAVTGDTSPREIDFGDAGRQLNGFKLGTIDGTSYIEVYISQA